MSVSASIDKINIFLSENLKIIKVVSQRHLIRLICALILSKTKNLKIFFLVIGYSFHWLNITAVERFRTVLRQPPWKPPAGVLRYSIPASVLRHLETALSDVRMAEFKRGWLCQPSVMPDLILHLLL